MKYRTGLILAAKDMGASGTETIDIKFKKPISRIEMTFKVTLALHEMAAGGPADIPKIELVDGSKPLHSLTGYTNQALAYYSRGRVSMEGGEHVATLKRIDTYAIDFGRYLHDPLLAFDPTRFDNPQLKITWNEALSDINATVNNLEIWAEMFDEKIIAPTGFLSAREIWSSAFGVANAYSDIDLPEDEIIRQILVRAYKAGESPDTQLIAARLDENAEDKIPWDYTDLGMYFDRMKSHWPMLEVPFVFETGTVGRLYYIAPTDTRGAVLAMCGNENAYNSATAFASGGKVTLKGSVTYGQYNGVAKGYLPWHCYQFPLGKQDDPEDWYNPAGKKPRLRLKSGSSGTGGTGTVVIETLHKY